MVAVAGIGDLGGEGPTSKQTIKWSADLKIARKNGLADMETNKHKLTMTVSFCHFFVCVAFVVLISIDSERFVQLGCTRNGFFS
jgi:hypothetical protein